jgi:PAS domain S-box-containing protein
MVKQLIDMDVFKKGVQKDDSSVFENLIELINQLFETPVLSICVIEDGKLNICFLQGLEYDKLPDANPLANNCIRTKSPIFITDFNNDINFNFERSQTPFSQFEFYGAIPLMNSYGEVIGVFEVADFVKREYSEKEIVNLKLISNLISKSLENFNVQDKSQKEAIENLDISRIVKAEFDAKESENNLLAIFNHAPTAMLIARPEDGLIMMVNKELQSLAEADAVDLIGMYTTEFYAYNFERDLFLSILLEKGSVKNLELRIKKKDGTIANCLVSSEMIMWKGEKMLLSGFIDISERKKSESLLIQNEERFRSLYNRTPVMLHSLNQNGDFVSVSDYWLAKLG